MFKREPIVIPVVQRESVPYAKSVTITEQRAPTDDSIRLAKEYEEKAWEAVAGRIIKDVPDIKAKVLVVEDSCETMETLLLFSVNDLPVKVRFGKFEKVTTKAIFKEIAEAIAFQITHQLSKLRK